MTRTDEATQRLSPMSLAGLEVLKLRTVRLGAAISGAAVLVTVLGVAGVMLQNPVLEPGMVTEALGHVGLVSLFSLVLGVTAVAGEYRHRTISDTYLTEPHRGRVVAAKLLVYTAAGLALGAVAALVAVVGTGVWFSARGGSIDWSDATLWRTVAGCVAWNGAFAAIGVGVGALVRNLVAAVVGALAWVALIEGVVAQLLGDAARWLPYRSGIAVGDLPPISGRGLSQGAAAGVLLAYVAAFSLAGVWFSVRRDVS